MRPWTLGLAALTLVGIFVSPSVSNGQDAAGAARTQGIASGAYSLTPDTITDEAGRTIDVDRGLIFLPENRSDASSRLIAVHFLRFPPLEKGAVARPPVFLLPGGPGWGMDFSDPLFFDEVQRLRRTRPVIYVSQRGYSGDPGLVPDMRVRYDAVPADAITSARDRAEHDRTTLVAAIDQWRGRGVDVRGYDIINITDDLNDLRRALGYQRIVLRGCSFGSQWSLAYMRRWPETVDRALLSGVEPLDYGYDSPTALWASLSRVAAAAEADPDLAGQIPPGGIMQALATVIGRLEDQPVSVTIRDPDTGGTVAVPIGADDLRELVTNLSLNHRRALDNLGEWPRFILELHAGDYRFLATRVLRARRAERSESLILPLINNSVGVSDARARRLRAEPEAKWLGDINLKESVTRIDAPTPRVADAFRADRRIAIPTLLVNGDYDWSTPIENAQHLAGLLDVGRLVTIAGGRHCTETNFGELSAQRSQETGVLYGFIDADFDSATPSTFFSGLSDRIDLAPIDFEAMGARSLYDEWLEEND